MENVSLTIDGRQLSVPKGTSVLKAAIEAGIQVPYYCYHPGLAVDASCRVCLVKIEKMPKLQTSCSTPCAEGMVVSTRTEEVVAARASTTSGSRVCTTMPSAQSVEQDVCSFGIFSILTTHTRQEPSMLIPG